MLVQLSLSFCVLLLLSLLLHPLPTTASFSTSPPTSTLPLVSPRKIVLLHMHDAAPFFSKLGAITLSNKRRYATRHSYELVSHSPAGTEGFWRRVSTSLPCDSRHTRRQNACYEEESSFAIDKRAATFGKIKLALAACVGREGYWMLWSDADALIVNQSVALEELIDDRFDLMVSVDWLMINAGVFLVKCSDWSRQFLKRVYEAREFDRARALDQSAFQHFFDTEEGIGEHVKYVPKHAINVYVEEYRAGDFLLHMAGKLYEATTRGAIALAHQFDVLSMVEDVEDVDAFFRGLYVLNRYAGVCNGVRHDSECSPTDERRMKLKEPLGSMSAPKRYRHVALRYYWMPDWTDAYDTEGWNAGRKVFDGKTQSDEFEKRVDSHDEL